MEETCTSIKHGMVLVGSHMLSTRTCGSTATLGGGLDPLCRLVGLRALIDFLVPAPIPRVPHMLVLHGVHARPLAVQPVRQRILIPPPLIRLLLCILTRRILPLLLRSFLIRHTLIVLSRHLLGVVLKWIMYATL